VLGEATVFLRGKGKETTMLGKLKKNLLPSKVEIFNVRWYPSNRICLSRTNRKTKVHQMPPLMVRKAEWRR
jgi:hypothetical protein